MRLIIIIFILSFYSFSSFYSFAESTTSSASTVTVSTDPKTVCQAQTGFYWSAVNNSCQRSQDLTEIRSCKDKTSNEEKQSCIHDAILNTKTMKDNSINDNATIGKGTLESFSQWPLSLIHGTFFLANVAIWKYGGSTCMSVKILALASLVGVGTDVGTWLYLKYKLNDLKKGLDTLPTNDLGDTVTTYTEFQKHTFDLLSKAYDLRSSVEKIRAIAYGATTALYAAAGIATMHEMANTSPCMGNPNKDEKADAGKTTTESTKDGANQLSKTVNDKMSGLSSSVQSFTTNIYVGPVRLALSVGMGLLSGVLAIKTWEAHKTSLERKDIIDAMAKNITTTTFEGICDGTARTDSSKPQCYCFTEKGERNTAERSGSDICKKYWTSLDSPIKTKDDDLAYNKTTGASDVKSGCVSVDRQFDPLCQCKKIVNAKGDNACMKSTSTINQAAPTGSAWSAELAKVTTQLLGGNGGSLSASTAPSMMRLASKLNQISDQEALKLNASRVKAGEGELQLGMNNAKDLMNKGKQLLSDEKIKNNLGDLTGSSNELLASSFPASKLKSELGPSSNDESLKYSKNTNNKANSKKSDSKSGFNLDSYYLEESAQDKKIANMRPQEDTSTKNQYNMDGGIEKNESNNLWDIISDAYKTKGMEKLFK